MLTYEVEDVPELGMTRIRILEEDGSCNSEPCYPRSVFPTADKANTFAKIMIDKIMAARLEPPPVALGEEYG